MFVAANLRRVATVSAIGIDGASQSELLDIVGGRVSQYEYVSGYDQLGNRVNEMIMGVCGK